jgi:hypothetical protein
MPRPVQALIAPLRGLASHDAPPPRCELCSAAIRMDHRHLVEVSRQRLLCCCDACAILLANGEGGGWHLVPTHSVRLPEHVFALTDQEWEELRLPIGIAFFVRSTVDARLMALYPGPAGVTESRLGMSGCDELEANYPVLGELEPDVEALLANRVDGARDYYVAPIDQCYALAGIVRARWRGVHGGARVGSVIRTFFAALQAGIRAPEVHPHE